MVIAILLLALFMGLYASLLAVRILRWLGYVQEKEYRLDRLQAFLFSEEGQQELFKVIPRLREFSWTKLKRPKMTLRTLLVLLVLLVTLSLLFLLGLLLWLELVWLLAIWLVLLYLLVPILIFTAVLPTTALVKARVYWQLLWARRLLQKHQPIVIGIGGSYGKTSTKFLLAALLKKEYSVFVTPKSFNTTYSVATSIVNGYQGQSVAILEYGAYTTGEIAHLTNWLPPNMAIITGLTEQHLSLFGSLDSSVLAESELVTAVPKAGAIYFNAADTGAEHIVTVGSQGMERNLRPYQVGERITQLETDDHGRLAFEYDHQQLQTALVGKHYGPNLAGSIAVAEELGVSPDQIKQALKEFRPNENYVRSYRRQQGGWVLDDGGTSNPVGFRAVIELAASFLEPNKILLTAGIVDLGEESAKIHLELAKAADKVFAKVLYLGVPGQAEFEEILEDKLVVDQDKIEHILLNLADNDLLVIEGKLPGWVEELV